MFRPQPDLTPISRTAIDGHASCVGADNVWTWTVEPPSVTRHGPEGVVVSTGAVPPADARCGADGSRTALAWYDGSGATLVEPDGARWSVPWTDNVPPRPVPRDSAWWVLGASSAQRPDRPAASASTLGTRSCDTWSPNGTPSPCVEPPRWASDLALVRMAPRPIATTVTDDGIVIADGDGWDVLLGGSRHTVRVSFAPPRSRVLALVDGVSPTVIACESSTGSRLVAFDAMRGTERSSVDVADCRFTSFTTSHRVALVSAGRTVSYEDPDGFVPTATPGAFAATPATAGSSLEAGWGHDPACGAQRAAFVAVRSAPAAPAVRTAGPFCNVGPRLVPVLDSQGLTVGAALEVGRDSVSTYVAFGLDGFALGTTTGPPGVTVLERADDDALAAGRLSGDSGLLEFALPGGNLAVLRTRDGVALSTDEAIWAEPTLWVTGAWTDGEVAHRIASPATAPLWDPSLLRTALRRAP